MNPLIQRPASALLSRRLGLTSLLGASLAVVGCVSEEDTTTDGGMEVARTGGTATNQPNTPQTGGSSNDGCTGSSGGPDCPSTGGPTGGTQMTGGVSAGPQAGMGAQAGAQSNAGAESGPNEETDELCSDGVDNDGNGYADCEDYACLRSEVVTVCGERGPEDSDETCTDGIDNDLDGFLDCEDFDCSRNDNVTLCEGMTAGATAGATGGGGSDESDDVTCADGIDNDNDGFVDCEDYSCSRNPNVMACGPRDPENTDSLCMDGIDNDNDGYTDCMDYDCSRNDAVVVCNEG